MFLSRAKYVEDKDNMTAIQKKKKEGRKQKQKQACPHQERNLKILKLGFSEEVKFLKNSGLSGPFFLVIAIYWVK